VFFLAHVRILKGWPGAGSTEGSLFRMTQKLENADEVKLVVDGTRGIIQSGYAFLFSLVLLEGSLSVYVLFFRVALKCEIARICVE
jgi:hypothetical protein